jgi:hypothetical protein
MVRSLGFGVWGSAFGVWGSAFCLLSSLFRLLSSVFSGFGPLAAGIDEVDTVRAAASSRFRFSDT